MTATDPAVVPLRHGLTARYISHEQLAAQKQAAPPPAPPDDQAAVDQRRRTTAAARSRARAPKAAK